MKLRLKPIVVTVASAFALGVGTAASAGDATRTGSQNQPYNQATTSQPGAAQSMSQKSAAQQVPEHAQQAPGAMMEARASKLMGMKVRNSKGDDLGDINDLAVDLTNNRIHYAILGHGGVLGVGEKEIAVPVSRFKLNRTGNELVVNMNEQQLKDAPELGRDRTNWDDAKHWSNVDRYYNRTLGMPATSGTTTVGFRRASDLIGTDVLGANGDEVGEIEDLVVNLSDGSIHYAVLEFDRAWNPNDKLVALPMDSFKPQGNDFAINLTREQIAQAPGFDQNQWPSLMDSTFRDSVAGFGSRDRSTVGMDQQSRGAQSGTQGTAGSSQQGTPDTARVTTTTILLIEEPEFLRLDTDRDGRLSRGEVREVQQLAKNWEMADNNSDGFLTREEIQQYQTRLADSDKEQRAVSRMDEATSKLRQGTPGQQSAGTSASGTSPAVTGMDQQSRSAQPGTSGSDQPRQTIQPSDLPGQAQGSAGAAGSSGMGALQIDDAQFSNLDKNNDGRVSREEARANPLLNQQFDQVDNDNDGQVTQEELRKHPVNRPGSPTSSGGQPGMTGGSASGAGTMTAGQGSGTGVAQQNK